MRTNSENLILPEFLPFAKAKSAQEIIRASQSSFFSSFRFLPVEQKHAMQVVYAFFRMADDCADEIKDPELKKKSLQFLSAELQQIEMEKPRHPVLQELATVIKKFSLPREYFELMIEGCLWDAENRSYETAEELFQYTYRVAGVVGLVCMRIFGHETETSDAAAVALGHAFQLTNILRDVAEDAVRERLYIPVNILNKNNIIPSKYLKAPQKFSFGPIFNELAEISEKFYFAGEAEFSHDAANRLVATRIMAGVYHGLLRKMKNMDPDKILTHRVSLSWFEKIKILLSARFSMSRSRCVER